MPIVTELNHFALLSDCIETTLKFYTRYLGLKHGPKLEGGFGEYLYFPGTNHAVIHMLDVDTAMKVNNSKEAGFQLYASLPEKNTLRNTNSIDHLAFTMRPKDFNELLALLKLDDVPHRIGAELAPKILQVWIIDPNGIKVEVNCFPKDIN